MDAYRAQPRGGGTRPSTQQPPLGEGGATSDGTPDGAAGDAARGAALSPADEALLRRPFVPVVSAEFARYAVAADALHDALECGGARAARAALAAAGGGGGPGSDGGWGDASPRDGFGGGGTRTRPGSAPQFRTTVARPFGFEGRAAARPATISAVKAEQDRAIKWQEAAALRRIR